MGFTRKLQYFLVHTLKYSNKEAKGFIENGHIILNGKPCTSNVEINETDRVELNGKLVRAEKSYTYIKFYKPVGYVSSLNPLIKDSLYPLFKDHLPLSIAGRLDKYSEGLLLLTNDGKWQQQITSPDSGKEKEYIVMVNKPITEQFIAQMSIGIDIGIGVTKPCICEKTDTSEFRIILTEGKNKQIRRMCKTLGYSVLKLKRIRIDHIEIQTLNPGEMLNFENMLQH